MVHPSAKTFKSFDGVTTYYEKHSVNSHNPTTILLHGLGGDLTAWTKERVKLNHWGYSTIAVDLRGHGLSSRPENLEGYKLDNFAKDIAGLIKDEKLHKPILIGHCFGGMISLITASLCHKNLSTLILIDTGFKPPHISHLFTSHKSLRNFLSYLAAYLPDKHVKGHINFQKFINTADYDWRRIVSDVAHVSLRSYLMICSNLLDFDATTILKNITAPCLIVEGLNDSIFPPIVAQALHSKMINSELNYIKNANHIIVLNNPDDLAESMRSFLKRLEK